MTQAPRRFLIIQIDGLAHATLEEALHAGRMPTLAHLLQRGVLRSHRMPVGLPTSTPAFQAALMYGGPVDIPAFEFLDKRTREYHLDGPARLEQRRPRAAAGDAVRPVPAAPSAR
jgi:hypothetical protein